VKILAYFGSDLDPVTGPEFLLKSNREGYTLLALDSGAMAAAVAAGLDYTLMEDWLSPESILRGIEDAAACETGWYEPARDEFTVDGICWPEFDHAAMMWFWQNVTLAEAFARVFTDREGRELKIFGNRFRRAAVFNDSSDAFNAIWKHELDAKVVELKRGGLFPENLLSQIRENSFRRLRGLLSRSTGSTQELASTFLQGSIVLVLGQLEARRFTHIAQNLLERFPGRVAAALGGPYQEVADEMASILGVPVATGAPWPLAPRWLWFWDSLALSGDSHVEKRFRRGYRIAFAASRGKTWEKALRYCRFHFKYFFGHRWPVLHSKTFAFWSNLWSRHRPRAVMVTNVWSSYYLSACLAAKRLGVPTLLAAHGGVQLLPPGIENLFRMDRVLYESDLQRSIYAAAGVSDTKLIPCRGLIAENEYETHKLRSYSADNKWRVLALLETTGVGPNLIPLISLRAQLNALKALAAPPADLSDRLDLHIKVHPFYQDLEIIAAAGGELLDSVLPAKADLHELISEVSLVVAVNYVGSALLHVLRAGRTVLYLLTEHEPLLKRPDRRFDIFMEAATVVRTADEFWAAVRDFFSDSAAAERMRLKSQLFARHFLDSNDAPEIGEALNRFC
jgi:hypothetical protein